MLGMSFGAVDAQTRGAALLIPSIAPARITTNRIGYLVWTNREAQSVVYTGATRETKTNRIVIDGNKYPITNGAHYGIAAINMAGIESSQALWPSNRVFELWTQTSSDLVRWQDSMMLERATNAAKTPAMFQRVVDKTVRWY